MSKISINMFLDPEAKLLLPQETLLAVTSGCFETLKHLGELGKLVEVFRVTFCSFGKEAEVGPCITVYYNNPLGTKNAFTTDFRFMGSGGTTPSATEIADALCKDLPRFMREHLQRGAKKLAATQNAYKQYFRMHPEKWPPISPGTVVKTTQPNWDLRKEWTDEGWAERKWGVEGKIVTHHDSHGLCYDVRHQDGTVGSYDPSELEVVK